MPIQHYFYPGVFAVWELLGQQQVYNLSQWLYALSTFALAIAAWWVGIKALPNERAKARALLDVFEHHRISLSSIHSSRTPAGEVHFRIGFGPEVEAAIVAAAAADIDAAGTGRVLECAMPARATD